MVRAITTDELFDLHDVRLMVESHAVRQICERKLAVPPVLHTLCAEHDGIEADDHLAFAELNRRFHETIVAASGNKVLLQVFESLRANLTRVAMLSFKVGVERSTEGRQHRAILDALENHDTATALELVETHLGRMPRLVASLPKGLGT